MNYVMLNTGYDFPEKTKEDVFTAWEHFLAEEKTRKYSPCMEYDESTDRMYISTFKAFRIFVTDILKGNIGTKSDFCRKYNMSEGMFDKLHEGEYVIIKNFSGEMILAEKEISEIFRLEIKPNSLDRVKIVRNFSPNEAGTPAKEVKV